MTAWSNVAQQAILDDTFPLPLHLPFTLRQAQDAGISRHQVRVLEREGLVRRLVKGAYVASGQPDSRLLRARALRLLTPEHCVVTDWTACWFWTGVSRPGDHEQEPLPSFFRPSGHDRFRNGICESGERTLHPADVVEADDLLVTTPLRTAWDLGRLAHRDIAIGALDALLRHGTFELDELVDGTARFKGMRGVVQLRALAPLADPRAESPGESTLRLRWLDIPALPRPEPQISITAHGQEVYRIDLGVRELRYGCEYDGEAFHPDGAADRARREDLDRRFGWDVEGVGRANVYGATQDVDRLLVQGIARARRSIGRRSTY